MKTQTFTWKHIVTTSTMIALASACAPTGFQATLGSPAAPNKTADATPTPVPQVCVPETADYLWDINIYGFSLSGMDFNVGYSGGGLGPIPSVDVGAKVTNGTLNLQTWTQKPFDSAHSFGTDKTLNQGFNFNIDLGIVRFGVGSNKDGQGAMIALTKATYQELLKNAYKDLSPKAGTWSTHITQQIDSDRFIMPVGALAGVQPNDTFSVYKYKYAFADGCEVKAQGSGKAPPYYPVATLKVVDIHDGYAVLAYDGVPLQEAGVNDLLEVKDLFKAKKSDKRAALKKAVRVLGLRQPNHITIGGTAEIDLTSYLNYQMPSLMNADANYWQLQ